MSGAATAVAIGVGVGAAVGGISSAISGGDIGMGILGGAVGGAVTGGIGGGLGGVIGAEAGSMAGVGVGALSGAAGGVVNSAITGGDPLMGALTGGAGGAFAGYNGAFDTGGGGFGENVDVSGAAPDASATGADLSAQGANMDVGGASPSADAAATALPTEPQGALSALADSSGSPMPDLPTSQMSPAPGRVDMSPLGPPSGANINTFGQPGNPNSWMNLPDPTAMPQDYLNMLKAPDVTFDLARADQLAQQAANPSFMDSPLGWAQSQATDFLNKPFSEQLKLGAMGVGGLGLVGSLMGGGSSGQASPAQVQGTPSKYWNTPLPSYGYAGATTPGGRPRNQYTGDITKYGYGPSFNFFDPRQMVQMAEGGSVRGPGGPKDDKIPAMLSDGEFVIPTDVVNALGNGNNDRGAGALHQMMTTARRGKRSRRAA